MEEETEAWLNTKACPKLHGASGSPGPCIPTPLSPSSGSEPAERTKTGWVTAETRAGRVRGDGRKRIPTPPSGLRCGPLSRSYGSSPSSAFCPSSTKLCGCRSHTPHLWASVFSHMSQEVRRCHNSLPLPLPMANIPDQSVHSFLWNPDSTQPPSNQCSWYRRQKHLCNPCASV